MDYRALISDKISPLWEQYFWSAASVVVVLAIIAIVLFPLQIWGVFLVVLQWIIRLNL